MMLEQHLHRGFREVEGVAFMLPWNKSAAGRACQGNNKRRRVLATAGLFSKTGSVVEKQCCLEGSNIRGWQAMQSLLPSSLSHVTLCSCWAPFHGEGSGMQGTEPRDVGSLFPPSVATSSSPQATPTGGVALISSASLSQKVPWPCPGLPAALTTHR